MSSILNIYYRETLDKTDSYEEYISELKKVEDKMWWGKATNKNTKRAYEKYLNNYSNAIYSFEAKQRIDEFIRVKRGKELEEQRLRDIEIAKERIRLEKIEKERKLALDKEKEAWELVCKKDTKEDYENYLKFYPDGVYTWEATQNIQKIINIETRKLRETAIKEENKTWKSVCKEDKSWSYSDYMKEYPNGIYFAEAQNLSEMLNIEITTKKYPHNRLFIYNDNIKKGVINRAKEIIIKAVYDDINIIGRRFIVVYRDMQQGLYSVDGIKILELGNYNLRVDGGGYKTEIIQQDNQNDDFQISAISYNKQWINHSNFMKMFDTSIIKIIDIKNNTFGYINNDDNLLLEPIYENIYLYKNGLGRILKEGGKPSLCGLINNKYELILDCNYGHIKSWEENNNYAVIRNKDWSKQGIVSIKGEIVIDFLFDSIEYLDNGYFIAYKGNRPESLKYGLIDPKGKIIIDVEYSRITYIKEEKIFLIEDNDKFGFTNSKGEITIEPELDEMYSGYNFDSYGHKPSNSKYKYLFLTHVEVPIKVKKGNKYGLIDKHGKYLLTPKYNYITFENYISKNIYLYMTSEDFNSYRKGFIIYNNGKITIVFSKNIDITYINILNTNLIEFRDTKFGAGISTIDGKILLESSNPISYKLQKNKIIKSYQ